MTPEGTVAAAADTSRRGFSAFSARLKDEQVKQVFKQELKNASKPGLGITTCTHSEGMDFTS